MTTKRFEDLHDCWRHGTGCIVECLACEHWKLASIVAQQLL
jgi:hypothetical protein